MKQRVISAVILLAIFVPVLLAGGTLFNVAMIIVACLSLHEMFLVRESKKPVPLPIKFIAYLLVIAFIITGTNETGLTFSLDYKYLAAFLFTFLLPIILFHERKTYTFNDATFVIASVLFIGVVFNLVIALRGLRLGYVLYLLIITIATDSFGIMGGSLVGKHKLLPDVSPKKTIEGAVYSLFMATVLGSAFYYVVLDSSISLWLITLISFALSLTAILGDLIFSAIKRYYQKKDFSNLIPGHGGVLDRIDSIIFVVLTFVILASFL